MPGATKFTDAPLQLIGTNALNGVPNGSYRGWLEFRPGRLGEVLAINAVGLEQYVAGVVANEAIPARGALHLDLPFLPRPVLRRRCRFAQARNSFWTVR